MTTALLAFFTFLVGFLIAWKLRGYVEARRKVHLQVKALEGNYILPDRGELIAEDQDASGDLPPLFTWENYRLDWMELWRESAR